MHGERCGVCWSATECFENRSPHMPCGRGQRKQKPESNGRADGFPTRPRAREDIFRPRRTGVCGRPQQLTELILTAQTGRFSKIFGTLTRRQILNQIFENPGLAQASVQIVDSADVCDAQILVSEVGPWLDGGTVNTAVYTAYLGKSEHAYQKLRLCGPPQEASARAHT